ncbi:hypothetical protein WDW37_16675 [Bdellovibrionota bacterium FG-1]
MKEVEELAALIRSRRGLLGITQFSLAQSAQVSLPTIQNLEHGKGNPCWSVLVPVCHALGLTLAVQSQTADWDLLIEWGVPLSLPLGQLQRSLDPRRGDLESFLTHLTLAALEVGGVGEERKREALSAFLFALSSHYPTFYAKHCSHARVLKAMTPHSKSLSGHLIKLKRQALAHLAERL